MATKEEEFKWILRYNKPQSALLVKPKVKINKGGGQPPYVCISHVRKAPDGVEWPFIEVPEEIGYYVLSRSSHWQLWSPSEVVVGVVDGLTTKAKKFVSVKNEMRLEEAKRIEQEASGLIPAARAETFDRMAKARDTRAKKLAELKAQRAAEAVEAPEETPAEDAGEAEE